MDQKDKPALSWPGAATSPELRERVAAARVLAVGAGGIGCELIKTLAMTGFKHIEVIDLDTIETSNLNRQFLFRKGHVGQSKAAVAAEAVRAMRQEIEIVAHQGNVKDPKYGLDFFRRFDLVLSGLDNLEARRHVNRLCLAAGVPLVESGTAGYLGQVSVHVRGATECFECAPKPAPKSYPVCTIRNTPDKPIHCVVWAKDLLFPRLFGSPDAATDLDDGRGESEGGEAEAEGEQVPKEDPSFYLRREGEGSVEYGARIFRRVFGADIEALLRVESLWKARRPPTPLDLDAILGGGPTAAAATVANGSSAAGGAGGARQENGSAAGGEPSACRALGLADAHAVWGLADNARVFIEAVRAFNEERPQDVGSVQFDKDDALAVEFVAAAANLRALCHGIPPLSLFDVKGMAGNIIHAIATTNAIVSGLIVVEALKLLAGSLDACRTTFLLQQPSNQRLLTPMTAPPPAPGCMVCGRAQVVKGRLSLVEPTLSCGAFLYEEGEGLEDDEVATNAALLPRQLCELPGGGLVGGSIVEVSDQRQQLTLRLVIAHQEDFGSEEDNPDGFVLSGSLPEPTEPAAAQEENGAAALADAGPAEGATEAPAAAGGSSGRVREDDDGVLVLDDSEDEADAARPAAGRDRKRKAGAEDGTAADGQGGKRAKLAAPAAAAEEEDVVIILDD